MTFRKNSIILALSLMIALLPLGAVAAQTDARVGVFTEYAVPPQTHVEVPIEIRGVQNLTTPEEYIRMISLSRIMLPNVKNIQASWLTVGKDIAQLCLHAGANDFGSIMIEENVVAAAGCRNRTHEEELRHVIAEAGFIPRKRRTLYEPA